MSKGTILAIVIVALLLVTGGVYVISREQVAAALRRAFEDYDLPASWGEALGEVESRLSLGAVNRAGADGKRGGAWGPTQITERTARAYGYTGPMEAFTTDLALAAEWTARIAKEGGPRSIEDLGAWWNAGRSSFDRLPADHVTRTVYVPRLVAALASIESEA